LGGPIDYSLSSKYVPISFLKIDSASTPIERASSVFSSITLDGRSHPDFWISRTGFESTMMHAGSQVISSSGLSTIKSLVD
jgi:hypothetical protein